MQKVTISDGQGFRLVRKIRDGAHPLAPSPGLPERTERHLRTILVHIGVDDVDRLVAISSFEQAPWDDAAELKRTLAKLPDELFALNLEIGENKRGPGKQESKPGTHRHICVERWIDGIPLDVILSGKREPMSISLLQKLIIDLANIVNVLQEKKLRHYNITSRNIVLCDPDRLIIGARRNFILVGNWSVRKQDHQECADADYRGPTDDECVVAVLCQAYNHMVRNRTITPAQKRWLWKVSEYLLAAAKDVNKGKRLSPHSLRQLALSQPDQDVVVDSSSSRELGHPFDYISAEHIGDESLLYKLFAQSCPWIGDVTTPVPLLLEGPRGCGKSMIMRWISLKVQLAGGDRSEEFLSSMRIAPFFISCTSEIQSRVGHIDTDAKAEGLQNELVHYLNIVVLREVADTLICMSRHKNSKNWGVDEAFGIEFLTRIISQVHSDVTPIAGVSAFEQAYDISNVALCQAQDALRREGVVEHLTSPAFLGQLSEFLSNNCLFFSRKLVTYCLDDYSVHRVSVPVQRVLNRVLFGLRNPNYICKITAENDGFFRGDLFGAQVDLERELMRLDLGDTYLSLSRRDRDAALEFCSELLQIRLELAGWKGTPSQLLGRSALTEHETVKFAKGGPEYYGLECIVDLCTGDIATILGLYRQIFLDAKVNPESTGRIPRTVQHAAICKVSSQQLDSIQRIHPYGQAMANVVEGICDMARWQASNHLSDGPGSAIKQRTCLEVRTTTSEHLSGLQKNEFELLQALLRRAVFVDMNNNGTALSDRSSLMLVMRRIFLPHFMLRLGHLDYMQLKVHKLSALLRDPKMFARSTIRNWEHNISDDQQEFDLEAIWEAKQ